MKALKWIGGIVLGLIILAFVGFQVLKSQTKKYSPEDTVSIQQNDLEISVYYNRPYKKDRVIFGELVPYGEVWRTGANEATTFTNTSDIQIMGKALPAGTYTLWTIPEADQWTVIFNKKQYGWGLGIDGKASREPDADQLQVKVPVQALSEPVEQFTISLEQEPLLMILEWDKTKIEVPLSRLKKDF